MLVAGALWVALVLVLLAAARRSSISAAALRTALGGLAAGAVLAGISLATGSLSAADFAGSGVWAYGIATGVATAAMLVVLRSRSTSAIAGVYLLVPSAMSLLLGLESVFGSRGPNPLLVGPIVAATVVVIAGVWLAWEYPADGARSSARGHGAIIVAARVVAATAVAAALLALVLPGMTATVQGLARRQLGLPGSLRSVRFRGGRRVARARSRGYRSRLQPRVSCAASRTMAGTRPALDRRGMVVRGDDAAQDAYQVRPVGRAGGLRLGVRPHRLCGRSATARGRRFWWRDRRSGGNVVLPRVRQIRTGRC